jgi:AcrR family transcriptional regulator
MHGGEMMKYKTANEIFRKIPEEKQNKIIEAALEEFARHGYSEANINKIADRANISVGSLYKYFNDKQNLYQTIVNYSSDTLREELGRIIDENDDIYVIIEKIIRSIQQYGRTHENMFKLYNEMTAENNSELTWKTAGSVEGVTADLYADLIEKAQNQGAVGKGFEPRYFAFFLDNLFMLLQFSYSCEYYRERLKMYAGEDALQDDERMCRQLLRFIKGAFRD